MCCVSEKALGNPRIPSHFLKLLRSNQTHKAIIYTSEAAAEAHSQRDTEIV